MSGDRIRVLIVGGYGSFGARLARLLSGEIRLTLLIAGRSSAKARGFCDSLPPGAVREATFFDRDGDLEAQLERLSPDVVIDASGPFQAYGPAPYRLAEAAIARGIDYLDFADSRDFVLGIAALDAAARRQGCAVLSGASTSPTLTVAVVRTLSKGLQRLERVRAGIVPATHTGLSRSVIDAVFGYAGKPIPLRSDGRDARRFAMLDSIPFTIAPPGRFPLPRLRFSLADVPDNVLLPRLWPELREVWFGAGVAPRALQLALNGLAWLVRLRLLSSLSPISGLAHRIVTAWRPGGRRSGMFVAIDGRDRDGQTVVRSWHLLAEDDDGPFVPAMAAAALMRRRLAGQRPAAGARAAIDELTLADYEAEFAGYRIATGRREASAATRALPLYRQLLGEAYERLSPPLRALHDGAGGQVFEGKAEVCRGRHPLARLVAAVNRFPAAGTDIPLRVDFAKTPQVEIWQRDFAGRRFRSEQRLGRGAWQGLLYERFGPASFAIAASVEAHRMAMRIRQWRFLGIPMPIWLAPRAVAYEHDADGRFNFHVEVSHPLVGLIVLYKGWLEPAP